MPDGRHFLFLVQPENSIRVGSLDSKETKSLLSADSKALYAPPGYLLFVRDGTLMAQPFDASRTELGGNAFPVAEQVLFNAANGRAAFEVSDSGVLTYRAGIFPPSQLVWLDRAGKQIGMLGEPGRIQEPEFSPDGTRLGITARDDQNNSDVWILDVTRSVRTRLTSDPASDGSPKWSSDGNQIVFRRSTGQQLGLYLKPTSGTGSEQTLLASARNPYPDAFSPDGRFLLYEFDDPKTTWDLWILPLADRKPRPFIQMEARQEFGRFSPDAKWIAYRSNETGRYEIYVVPFPDPNRKSLVSTAGGGFPRWRRDGREIFYVTPPPDDTLMAAEVNGQGANFEVGIVRPLFKMPPTAGGNYTYDVSADGQRFLINRAPEAAPTPVTVVVNWTAGLRK